MNTPSGAGYKSGPVKQFEVIMIKKPIFFAVFVSMILLSCSDFNRAPLISVEDFFRNPEKTDVQLSPDGKYLSFLQPWNGRLNLHVLKIGSDKIERITDIADRDIPFYRWANNHRLVYAMDNAGDGYFNLYGINADGENLTTLTSFKEVKLFIIDPLINNDKEMMIGTNKRDKRYFDAYRINVYTGKQTLVAKNPGNVISWICDRGGRLRIAVTAEGLKRKLLYRKNENKPFKAIFSNDFSNFPYPLSFTDNNKTIYVLSNYRRDKEALYEYDPEQRKMVRLIFEHPDVDVTAIRTAENSGKLLWAKYITDRVRFRYFDEDMEKLAVNLKKKFTGQIITIPSMSRDGNKILIKTFSDTEPEIYYYHNRSTGEFIKLLETKPWLLKKKMAAMQPITFTTSDSLEIHGYLTLPVSQKQQKLPAVILIHGGFWDRDYLTFNEEVQFLANRGYAVLQINYRGSGGYGKNFYHAGYKQYGSGILQDFEAAVRHFAAAGIIDEKNVAVYGKSLGGFIALSAAAASNAPYKCAVSYSGIINLYSFIKNIPPYWEIYDKELYEIFGNPVSDKEMLMNISPIYHPKRFKIPVFIAQGANDKMLNREETDLFIRELRKNNVPVKFMEKEDEGHIYRNQENRFDFYKSLELFLAENLGGKVKS